MSRLVKRNRTGPYEVKAEGKALYICGCGLSANLPFCDGTHKTTASESPGKLYWYDEDGERHETADVFPGMREDTP